MYEMGRGAQSSEPHAAELRAQGEVLHCVLVDTDCLLMWASLRLARRLEEGSTCGTEVEESPMGLSKASAKTAIVFPYSFENKREKKRLIHHFTGHHPKSIRKEGLIQGLLEIRS